MLTTHCGSLIEVESYLDTVVEPIFDVLVFAHGPYFLNDLNSVSLGLARIQGLFVYARLISQSRGSILYRA